MAELMDGRNLDDLSSVREPIIVHELVGVLSAMDTLKNSRGRLVMVVDEYGVIQGLLTPIDILEAVAGEFPDEDEHPTIQLIGPDLWRIDGSADLRELAQALDTDALFAEGGNLPSVAGMLLDRFGALPETGATLDLGDLRFEVVEISNRRIATVELRRITNY
jgi:CBS domain containing-hemolysin-like protein